MDPTKEEDFEDYLEHLNNDGHPCPLAPVLAHAIFGGLCWAALFYALWTLFLGANR